MSSSNNKVYEIAFRDDLAEKHWKKLPHEAKVYFVKQLKKICNYPKLAKPLRGDLSGFYKLKLRTLGYRLVYELRESELVLVIIDTDTRNNDRIYNSVRKRLK